MRVFPGPQPSTLWNSLDQLRLERPDDVALVHSTGRLTYRQLCAEAEALACGLLSHGAQPGDTISFQMPNWSETVLIALAAMRIGAICNPIITIYRAKEVSFILENARARFVFVPETYRGFQHAAMVSPLAEQAGARLVVCRGKNSDGLTFDGLLRNGYRLRNSAEWSGFDAVNPASDALYLYTSGTEGRPKGVRHSHATLLSEAGSVSSATQLSARDTLFMGSPLTHITGFMYAIVLGPFLGAKVCLQDVWEIHEAAALIDRESCAWTVGATPFLQGLLDPELALQIQSLRIFRCGGADVPPQLIRRAQERGIRAMRTYGCSEHPTISGGVGDDPAKAATTDGRVHPQNQVRIIDLDDDSHVLPPGEVGEIQTKGDELFLGYVDASLNERAFTGDGWFRTGDLGRLDSDRYITVVGRRKDIIIRKGENISAKEVEDLILDLPHVLQCAVVGVPDEERGELMVAACVLASGTKLSLGDITDHLQRAGIARQKFPERLETIAEMPMNAAGKILKSELRGRFSTTPAMKFQP
ncbi:AMP-binding protein [Microvirga antarctica]|uniref:AMP-binding protein n=1 Tax=Microvirga antarctica TaxID=2819233 RepID=UPI001B303A6F|nr:AMP-binding protein [Microvirga antarctica]